MLEQNAKGRLAGSFYRALGERDKAGCLDLVLQEMRRGTITVPELYEEVLAYSLNQIASNQITQRIAIWEEHVQSGIVRSAIEVCYPYVLAARQVHGSGTKLPKALVLCQEEEYHELGARMATDFLTLLGFDAVFIGANTPAREAYAAVRDLKPVLVCLSVTNFFHLTRLQRLIDGMRELCEEGKVGPFRIVAGGHALANTPGARNQISPDDFAFSFRDLQALKEAHYATSF